LNSNTKHILLKLALLRLLSLGVQSSDRALRHSGRNVLNDYHRIGDKKGVVKTVTKMEVLES
jgi:hypothetical protein